MSLETVSFCECIDVSCHHCPTPPCYLRVSCDWTQPVILSIVIVKICTKPLRGAIHERSSLKVTFHLALQVIG